MALAPPGHSTNQAIWYGSTRRSNLTHSGFKAYVCWNDWSDSKAGCISDWLALIPSDFDLLATPIVKIPILSLTAKQEGSPTHLLLDETIQMTWPCFITLFLSTRLSSIQMVHRPARDNEISSFLFRIKSNKGWSANLIFLYWLDRDAHSNHWSTDWVEYETRKLLMFNSNEKK